MTELFHKPSFPLSQWIDAIWVSKAASFMAQSQHHAPLFTELIFNYGHDFVVEGDAIENSYQTDCQIIISGLKTSPFQTTVSGNYCNVGFILKPFCYNRLQKSLEHPVLKELTEVLYEALVHPTKPQFDVVEPMLLSLFKDLFLDADLLKFERSISSDFLQKGALNHFQATLNISPKSFIQKFKKQYVLTPKQYVKLRQINYAVQLLGGSGQSSLTHIGLEAGFYDQSHFIRTFKQFCGTTPKQFQPLKKL